MRSGLRQHLAGLVFVALTVLVGLAAMNTQNNLLFWVFGVLVATIVMSALLAMLVIRSVHVRRLDPHYGAVGEPLIIRYAVTNRSRWISVFNLHVQEEDPQHTGFTRLMSSSAAWVMHAGPRETVHGEALFWPARRGLARFELVRVHTTFPFGVIRRSCRIEQVQHVLIYPMMYELRRGLLESIAPLGLMGSKIAHHAGAGDDYFGMREYRPGDSMRHVSWKRTARTDQLVTIERTNPAPAKIRVVLDLTVATDQLPGAAGDRVKARDMEEKAISLAASLIHEADLDGFEVGLTVLGVPSPPIAVRRNQWHFHKIMAALAEIDLDGPRQAAAPLPVRDAERVAMVVIAPDRIQPFGVRDDVSYLTSAQLDSLAVRPLGWSQPQAARPLSQSSTLASHAHVALGSSETTPPSRSEGVAA